MKKTSLIAIAAFVALSAQAQAAVITTLDEWTFEGGAPQTSDIQSKTMGNWNPALAGTSVPSAGLLRDATGGNSSYAFWGETATRNAAGGGFDSLTVTVDIADWNHTSRDVGFEFGGPNRGGNLRVELNSFNGNFSIDVEGGGTNWSDSSAIFDTDDYTGAINFQMAVTWDFLNDIMSYTVAGSGVGGPDISDTQSTGADLSSVESFTQLRVLGGTVGAGEYMDLDTVTIGTTVIPEPSAAALMGGALALASVMIRRRR